MRILALDTTTEWGSVALVEDGRVTAEHRVRAKTGHSAHVLPAVDLLMKAAAWTPATLDGFAVTHGPGSFTGLRVGLSTVQGLALGAGKPCLGVTTLDVLAARMRGAAAHLVPVMDAFREQVFGAVYDREAHRVSEPQAQVPGDLFAEAPAGSAFLGDAVERYRTEIAAACAGAVFPARSLFLAGTLGLLAEPRLRAGEGRPPGELRPMYLRAADIRVSAPAPPRA